MISISNIWAVWIRSWLIKRGEICTFGLQKSKPNRLMAEKLRKGNILLRMIFIVSEYLIILIIAISQITRITLSLSHPIYTSRSRCHVRQSLLSEKSEAR